LVCKHYNISRTDILSARRSQGIVRPRQVAFYLCKELTGRSMPEIGRKFGDKDHTTVLHGIRKVGELMARDSEFASEVAFLKNKLLAA
jgi:chromosomal replication initiator protein